MKYVVAFVLLAFLGSIGIFAIQNTQSITVRFLSWSIHAPVSLIIVGTYALGTLSGWYVISFLKHSIHRVSSADRPRA